MDTELRKMQRSWRECRGVFANRNEALIKGKLDQHRIWVIPGSNAEKKSVQRAALVPTWVGFLCSRAQPVLCQTHCTGQQTWVLCKSWGQAAPVLCSSFSVTREWGECSVLSHSHVTSTSKRVGQETCGRCSAWQNHHLKHQMLTFAKVKDQGDPGNKTCF